MKTLTEALTDILGHVHQLEAEEKPLFNALGQALAEDVRSEYDLPMLDMCGPDGYAVRSQDVSAASPQEPVVLRVIGSNRAGYLPKHQLEPGTAVRVMTGSSLPQGADCVIPFENTDEPGNKNGPGPGRPSRVKILRGEEAGANIHRAGATVRKGWTVVPRGTSMGPAQVSALASIGRETVRVIRRPRVAIISTGDELIRLGKPLLPGKSYDCNSAALAALVSHYGGIPQFQGITRDSEPYLIKKLQKSLGADVILTSGGVSKGDYDLVRLVLGKLGRVVFARINTGPGASFAFGLVDRGGDEEGAGEEGAASVPVFGLAGPPVGCLINFEMLVRPALLKMMGCSATAHPVVDAVAADSVPGKKPMDFVKWAQVKSVDGGRQVVLGLSEELGITGAMATGNSLAIIPEGTEVVAGDRLQVLPLDWTRW